MRFLGNRWVALIAALVLGGFFTYASWHKIQDPPDFAKAVFNFKLVPWQAINATAIYLPWFELLAGLAVLTGLGRRGGAFAIAALLCVFIAAIGFNLYRGHPTVCGCFETYESAKNLTAEVKFFRMKREILLDTGLLLLSALVIYASFARSRDAEPAPRPS
jgi:uncharacterized membrane protein YphA (DoxX/SURF4 family)